MSEEETKVAEPVVTAQSDSPQISPENEINWKKFREDRAIERKAMQEAQSLAKKKEEEATALKAAMEALLNKSSTQQYQQQDDVEESEDTRIQKKIDAALAAERKRNEDAYRERESREYPNRLKQAHPDFDQVCSQDNLDYLDYHFPEIAKALESMPNGYDKWDSIYKATKRLIPNTNTKKDERKAENNFNKPQSMAVGGRTQTSDEAPRMLDDKKREANWARMQRVMKSGS